jgi:uncharacterized membrane protein
MWSFLFLGLILIVLIGVWVAKFSSEAFPRVESSADTLKTRYEQGEIDKDEYEKRLAKLRAD